jgi:hypothetical protein
VQIAFDSISTGQTQPIPQASPVRAPQVDGPKPRDRARDRQRESAGQNRQSDANFRAVLGAEQGAEAKTSARATTADTAVANPSIQPQARPTRIPDRRPPDVEQGEGAEIFRQSHSAATGVAPSGETQSRFLKAADSYAARFFSIASTYAKPGEKLEILA